MSQAPGIKVRIIKWEIVQFSYSVVSNSLWPHGLKHARLLYHQFLELTQTHGHRVSDAIQPSHHLSSLLLLPSIFPSTRFFSNESVLHIRWPKYWSFSISPSNEYSRLISSRIDWLDLLAVQGTLKSLLQHYSSKASILWCLALFIVQLSHPHMTLGKTIALTRQTFVGKIMSLLLNIPEIKRYLLLGRKTMTILDSVLKSRDITKLQYSYLRLKVQYCHQHLIVTFFRSNEHTNSQINNLRRGNINHFPRILISSVQRAKTKFLDLDSELLFWISTVCEPV